MERCSVGQMAEKTAVLLVLQKVEQWVVLTVVPMGEQKAE